MPEKQVIFFVWPNLIVIVNISHDFFSLHSPSGYKVFQLSQFIENIFPNLFSLRLMYCYYKVSQHLALL